MRQGPAHGRLSRGGWAIDGYGGRVVFGRHGRGPRGCESRRWAGFGATGRPAGGRPGAERPDPRGAGPALPGGDLAPAPRFGADRGVAPPDAPQDGLEPGAGVEPRRPAARDRGAALGRASAGLPPPSFGPSSDPIVRRRSVRLGTDASSRVSACLAAE